MHRIKEEFLNELQTSLISTCEETHKLSDIYCENSYIDTISCNWYHSVWQYLRIIDCVSSPSWHFEFYYTEFLRLINDKTKILICGTADYSLLALINFVANKKKVFPQIYVFDACKTPLLVCEKFAENHRMNLTTIQSNILDFSYNETFDIITTDAFLSRFSYSDKNIIIEKWEKLLSKTGKIITTIKVNCNLKRDTILKYSDNEEKYSFDVSQLVKSSLLKEKEGLITKMSINYINNITSIPFTNKKEIEDLFNNNNLFIDIKSEVNMRGEVKSSKVTYYYVIAYFR